MDSIEKRFYRIREVAEIVGVPLSTLRFWEKQFTVIKPKRNDKGTRLYTPNDVRIIETIYYLVKERGLKLEAAQELLKQNPEGVSKKASVVVRLKSIREELTGMIEAIDSSYFRTKRQSTHGGNSSGQ